VLQQIVNGIDFGMNPAEAASRCFHHQWTPDELRVEKGFSPDTIKLLKDKGQNVVIKPSMGPRRPSRCRAASCGLLRPAQPGRQDAGVLSPAPSPSSPPPGGLFMRCLQAAACRRSKIGQIRDIHNPRWTEIGPVMRVAAPRIKSNKIFIYRTEEIAP
jgi:hypothetical protein